MTKNTLNEKALFSLKLLDWLQLIVSLILVTICLYFSIAKQDFWTCFLLLLLVCFFSVLQFFKSREYKSIRSGSTVHDNPILTLSSKGVDLPEYSEIILLNIQNIDEKMAKIDSSIHALNNEIKSIHSEMQVIYQVVTLLATEEVNLIDVVNEASSEIKFMFEIINAVIEEIELRNETMEEMVKQSRFGAEKVNRTTEVIGHLSESSGGMLKMIDFINGITKKTNLLAINASIEATHSGDSGKGFTVIAEEMRNMAVLTSQNAKEISKLLMNNIEEYAEASIVSRESGESFAYINAGVQSVHGTIAEVLQTIAELKSRGAVVIEKTEKMDKVAVKVKNTSGEVYGEIVLMNENLDRIQELSETLRVESEAIKEHYSWQLRMTKKFRSQVEELLEITDAFVNERERT